ncbi:MAG: hypothetical protein AAFV53_17360 [Myxococcota bacterium]
MGISLALGCAAALVALGDLRGAVHETIALMLIWGVCALSFRPERGRPYHVLLAALAIRAVMLLSPPTLSDDLFRYLWEGHAAWEGGNPYLYPPNAAMWPDDPIRAQVNHPEVSSIYPPMAIWGFALLGQLAYHPISIKAAMGVCDALIAWGLARILVGRRRALTGAWLYALHPLAVVESAGSGHLEPASVLCMVMAIYAWDRGFSGVLWAGLGGLIKLVPGVLLLRFARRSPASVALIVVLGIGTAAPFLDAGLLLGRGLSTYAQHWAFNASLFSVYSALFGTWARPLAVGTGVAVTLWALARRADPAVIMLWVGGAFVLLSPTVHPWYIAWAWVPALICGVRSWSLLATLAPLSYVALASYDPTTSSWEEPAWPAWAQHLPFLIALLVESLWHQIQPGPWAPGASTDTSPSRSQTSPDRSTPDPRSAPSRIEPDA